MGDIRGRGLAQAYADKPLEALEKLLKHLQDDWEGFVLNEGVINIVPYEGEGGYVASAELYSGVIDTDFPKRPDPPDPFKRPT